MSQYSFCEPVWAHPTSRIHVRNLEGGEPKYGGGINTPTLCGRLMDYGWDIPGDVDETSLDYMLTCVECVDEWMARALKT